MMIFSFFFNFLMEMKMRISIFLYCFIYKKYLMYFHEMIVF